MRRRPVSVDAAQRYAKARSWAADPDDRCPNEPETINRVRDDGGCPDQGAITVTCRAIEIRDTIYFETDRAVIQRRSHHLLNQIAAVLGARPDIRRVSIEGHTDGRGSEQHNQDLSTRRAEAVCEYLVTQGIASERLVSRGFGETRRSSPTAPRAAAPRTAAWSPSSPSGRAAATSRPRPCP